DPATTSVPPLAVAVPVKVFAAVSVRVPAPFLTRVLPVPLTTLVIEARAALVTVRLLPFRDTPPTETVSVPAAVTDAGPASTVTPPVMLKMLRVRLRPPAAVACSAPAYAPVPVPADCVMDPAVMAAAVTLAAPVIVRAPRAWLPPTAPTKKTLP